MSNVLTILKTDCKKTSANVCDVLHPLQNVRVKEFWAFGNVIIALFNINTIANSI